MAKFSKTIIFSICLSIIPILPAQDTATSVEDDEVFELSPFTVDGSGNAGYYASETLAANRLRQNTFDTGVALTIITAEMLDDLGISSFQEALKYSPNTNESVGGIVSDPVGNNQFFAFGAEYRSRGFVSSTLTTDFFPVTYPHDTYNIERITFTRGPNSILFGLGNPGGLSNSIWKVARFNNFGLARLRLDHRGSYRADFDHNRVILKDRLAIRVAGVYADTQSWRQPAKDDNRRFYITTTLKALNLKNIKSEFKVHYDTGEIDQVAFAGSNVPGDGISPWLNDGRPGLDLPTSTYSRGIGLTGTLVNVVAMPGTFDFVGEPIPSTVAEWVALPLDGPNGRVNLTRRSSNQIDGIQNVTNSERLVVFHGGTSAAGVVTPLQNVGMSGQGRLNQPRVIGPNGTLGDLVTGFTDARNHVIGLVDESIFPHKGNLLGYGVGTRQSYDNVKLSLENNLWNKFFVELAYNHQKNDRLINLGIDRNTDNLKVDVNRYLFDGSVNPNFGMYYVESVIPSIRLSPREFNVYRATTSYTLDAEQLVDGWLGRLLGQQLFAAFFQIQDETVHSAGLNFFNGTPQLTQALTSRGANVSWADAIDSGLDVYAQVNRGLNRLSYRSYVDPAAGQYGPTRSLYDTYPQVIFKGQTNQIVPNTDPTLNGVSPIWSTYDANLLRGVSTREKAWYLAMQSFWWDNRVITSLGIRNDERTDYTLPRYSSITDDVADHPTLPEFRRGAVDQLWNDPRQFNPRNYEKSIPRDITTYTAGVTLAPFENVRIFYHYSTTGNFAAADQENILGRKLGDVEGTGQEIGVRLRFWEGRIITSINYFKTSQLNQSYATLRNQLGINAVETINKIWEEVSRFTGKDLPYQEIPYRPFQGWTDTFDLEATGYELSVTANVTENWRLTFNLSTQKNVQTNIGGAFKTYVEKHRNLWLTGTLDGSGSPSADGIDFNTIRPMQDPDNPINLPLAGTDEQPENIDWTQRPIYNGLTPAEAFASLQTVVANLNSFDGQEEARVPKLNFNLVTNYTFNDSFLDGFSVGGDLRWRGKRVVGYALLPDLDGPFDVSNPYEGGTTLVMGMHMRYQRDIKLAGLGKVTWQIQLNIRNLLNDRDPRVTLMRDRGDGTPINIMYDLPEPRTFVLTNVILF